MHRQLIAVGLVFSSLAVLCGCVSRTPSPAATSDVSGPCVVALAPGQGQGRYAADVARTQQEARGGPHAKASLERLGYLYVARARANNDPGDYKLAEATADCLRSLYPGEAAALLLRGHVLHQLHRFAEAEGIARQLVAKRTVVLDFGLLGDALMEQGRLEEAAAAYQRMIDLKPFYQSYTRAAHMRWLKGDLDGALLAMRQAVASASARDPESSAWAWTRMALYELQAARPAAALEAVEAALQYQAEYAAALLAKGRILLAQGKGADAVSVLSRAASLDPLPEYQWILADALRGQHRDGEARDIERELVARGTATDPRTVALYLATRGVDQSRALSLADAELSSRADIFTLDARAWALAASGRIPEALTVIGTALAPGTQDGRLFLHAGVIHAAAGHRQEASRWLGRAARLRAMLLPSENTLLDSHLTPTSTN